MNTGLSLRKISYYLPKIVQTNDQLKVMHPEWEVDKVQQKTGIYQRYIAKKETSLDLGFCASKSLFKNIKLNLKKLMPYYSFLKHDYALPQSSCILQESFA